MVASKPVAGYAQQISFLFQYDQAKNDAHAFSVVNLWRTILTPHFTKTSIEYSEVEREDRLLNLRGFQKIDSTIRCVLYIPEKTAKEIESADASDPNSIWEDGVRFLSACMLQIRSKRDVSEMLFGAVAVGTRVRFFSLDFDLDRMQDFGDNVQDFEVKEDEKSVVGILNFIATIGKHLD